MNPYSPDQIIVGVDWEHYCNRYTYYILRNGQYELEESYGELNIKLKTPGDYSARLIDKSSHPGNLEHSFQKPGYWHSRGYYFSSLDDMYSYYGYKKYNDYVLLDLDSKSRIKKIEWTGKDRVRVILGENVYNQKEMKHYYRAPKKINGFEVEYVHE